jgi:hypothetical protein
MQAIFLNRAKSAHISPLLYALNTQKPQKASNAPRSQGARRIGGLHFSI